MKQPSQLLQWLKNNKSPEYFVEPDDSIKHDGFKPSQPFTAEHFNWMMKNLSDWDQYLGLKAPDAIVHSSLADAIKGLPENKRGWVWVEDFTDATTVNITRDNLVIQFSPRFNKLMTNSSPKPQISVSANDIVFKEGLFHWDSADASNLVISVSDNDKRVIVLNTTIINGSNKNVRLDQSLSV